MDAPIGSMRDLLLELFKLVLEDENQNQEPNLPAHVRRSPPLPSTVFAFTSLLQ